MRPGKAGFILTALIILSGVRTPGLAAPLYSASVPEKAIAVPERAEHAKLTFFVEGMEETEDVLLHVRNGYSLYVPPEGWHFDAETDGNVTVDTWQSVCNEAVRLQVVCLGERSLAEAQAWVKERAEEFVLIEDKQGGLGGTDKADQNVLEAVFHPGEDRLYALILRYPTQAVEGFGTRLHVLADTFGLACAQE